MTTNTMIRAEVVFCGTWLHVACKMGGSQERRGASRASSMWQGRTSDAYLGEG